MADSKQKQAREKAFSLKPSWLSTLNGSWLLPLLLVLAGLLAYYNSFTGVFLFDDEHAIVNAQQIRRLWPFNGPSEMLQSRSLVLLSLAVNHALGGLNPWGYHLFNLAAHLLAGLVLYDLVRRTLLLEPLRARYQHSAHWLAFAAALLWLVHPLQTESVTYVVQRAEVLMGLFYLLTLYCVLLGQQACTAGRAAWPWYAAAVVCVVLGMQSKEVMVTAPVAVLLYDRIFLAPTWMTVLRRRWGLYACLAACWGLLAGTVVGMFQEVPATATVGFTVRGVTALEYARTQPEVILHYLRLALWPVGLCLDYSWPVARTIQEVLPAALVVAALLAATLWALWKRPALGFCAAFFFLVLAPTSSVVPVKDLAVEHRLYLPLAALTVLVVLSVDGLARAVGPRLLADPGQRRLATAGLLLGLTALLGWLTVQRNELYRNPRPIWADVVAKRPQNARAQNNLGNCLVTEGKAKQAIPCFEEALRLDPTYYQAHHNLGNVLLGLGETKQAIVHFRKSLHYWPNNPRAHNNLGDALCREGNLAEAVEHFREAIRLDPEAALGHFNLANTLFRLGKPGEAVEEYREALRLDPDLAPAHGNLAGVLLAQGKAAEAVVHYRKVLRLEPTIAPMHNNLGLAYLMLDDWEHAEAAFHQAVELVPQEPTFHRNLAYALGGLGRSQEAKEEYRVSLRLRPDWPHTLLAEAWSLATHPDARYRDGIAAVRSAEQILQARGDRDPRVLDALAAAWAERGQFSKAVQSARSAVTHAKEGGQTVLAREIEARLALYERERPYRTPMPR